MPEENPDIDAYIEREIDERLKTGKLIISNTALIEKVKSTLRSGADGMFLWVYLQIIGLCLMETDHDIEQSLNTLPSGLPETYSRLLRYHSASRYRKALFELVIVAYEPLTISQLREALSVEPGNTNFDPTKVMNSIDRVIKNSAGLLITDEEENTVRFVHHSVSRFLTSPVYKSQIDLELRSAKMTHIILTYLNYSLFETQVVLRDAPELNAAAIAAGVLMTVLPGGRKIIKPSPARYKGLKLLTYARPELATQNQFLVYAESYWLPHVMDNPLETQYSSLLRKALSKGKITLPVKYDEEWTPIQKSVKHGRTDSLSIFLDYGVSNDDKETALCLAARYDKSDVIDLLAEKCRYLSLDRTMQVAIEYDSPSLWQFLLRHYPDIDAEILNGEHESMEKYTPLMYAILCGSPKMIQELLADTRVNIREKSQKVSPMMLAVELAQLPAVQLLSRYGQEAIVESQSELWIAANRSCKRELSAASVSIVKLFITTRRIDLAFDYAPLVLAGQLNLYNVVKIMLEFNDEINAQRGLRPRYNNDLMKHVMGKAAWDVSIHQDIKTLLEEHAEKSYRAYHVGS